MSKQKILVVDDEPGIREFLAQVLSNRYQVFLAKDGSEGFQMALNEKPTAVVLDILMPGQTGVETCRMLRVDPKTKSIPVLMLTSVDETDQRTEAFLAGADDYIQKPCNPTELLARIESKIRRVEESLPQFTDTLQFGDLNLDFHELKVAINENVIDLGHIEFKIMSCLMKHRGTLVERETLHRFVWGNESPSDRALDPHITFLRRKLKPSRCDLKTVYGRGYSLVLREAVPIAVKIGG